MSDYYVNASEAIRMVRAWDKTEGMRSTYTADDVVYLLEHLTPVQANEMRSHGQWISCKERLPELDEICLVTEKDGSIRHCYFDSADPVLFATVEEGMYVRNVIAWMPLPEPYKEEQHG